MRPLLILLVALLPIALAQQSDKAEFEVVSIKPGDPVDGSSGGSSTKGGMRMHNTTLATLVRSAYGLNEFQFYGGPKWLKTAKFDIEARFAASAHRELIPQMMQNMLADRFKLVIHRETRNLQQYDLTVAKGGFKLEPLAEDGEKSGGMSQGPRMLRLTRTDMASLARQLIGAVEAPVRDRTGLTGHYNINLAFAPIEGATPEDDARPSIFAALQQIGLKLEPTRGDVEVVVIDSAEMPEAN